MFSRIEGEGGRVVGEGGVDGKVGEGGVDGVVDEGGVDGVVGEGGVDGVVGEGGELFIAGEQVGHVTARRECVWVSSQMVRMSHRWTF